jgi:hypothetical protein
MLPGEGVEVVVVVGVEVVFDAELPAPPDEELPPRPDEEPLDGDVLGTTTVTVTLGVVLVATTFPDPVFDLPPVPDPLPGLPVVPGWKAAYSTVPPAGAE